MLNELKESTEENGMKAGKQCMQRMKISTKRINFFSKKHGNSGTENCNNGTEKFTRGVQMETCAFEDRLLKSSQRSMKKKYWRKSEESLRDVWVTNKEIDTCIVGVPTAATEEKEAESLFEEIMDKNFQSEEINGRINSRSSKHSSHIKSKKIHIKIHYNQTVICNFPLRIYFLMANY